MQISFSKISSPNLIFNPVSMQILTGKQKAGAFADYFITAYGGNTITMEKIIKRYLEQAEHFGQKIYDTGNNVVSSEFGNGMEKIWGSLFYPWVLGGATPNHIALNVIESVKRCLGRKDISLEVTKDEFVQALAKFNGPYKWKE